MQFNKIRLTRYAFHINTCHRAISPVPNISGDLFQVLSKISFNNRKYILMIGIGSFRLTLVRNGMFGFYSVEITNGAINSVDRQA